MAIDYQDTEESIAVGQPWFNLLDSYYRANERLNELRVSGNSNNVFLEDVDSKNQNNFINKPVSIVVQSIGANIDGKLYLSVIHEKVDNHIIEILLRKGMNVIAHAKATISQAADDRHQYRLIDSKFETDYYSEGPDQMLSDISSFLRNDSLVKKEEKPVVRI